MIYGVVWLYFLFLLFILKVDMFVMFDVEGKVRSFSKFTGEAMSTMCMMLCKLSWIGLYVCVLFGMIVVYCIGYVCGIFGFIYFFFDVFVS